MPTSERLLPLKLGARQIHGRAVNVIAAYLRHSLLVPDIYLQPKIARVSSPDILAVDRGGAGDFHGVKVRGVAAMKSREELRAALPEIKASPFHFKYLALPYFAADMSNMLRFANYPELFDSSGIGRVGILSFDASIFDPSSSDATVSVTLVVRPERFRIPSERTAMIEKFLTKNKPDISVRI